MKRKIKEARQQSTIMEEEFIKLDATVPDDMRALWESQERKALDERLSKPSAMDIFDIQFKKGR